MSKRHEWCVEGKIRAKGIRLPSQEGPFHCPLSGVEHNAAMLQLSVLTGDDFASLLQDKNPGMSKVRAMKEAWSIRMDIFDMAMQVFQTPESFKDFFDNLGPSSALISCVLCQQLAKEGRVRAVWTENGNFPAPSRPRTAIPLNASSKIGD